MATKRSDAASAPTASRRSARGSAKTTAATTGPRPPAAPARLEVRKTHKLYVSGAFVRSESGRSYPIADSHGAFLANAAQGSRKDARDAVRAARAAFSGWSRATAYNRGQVLYRVAEVMEARSAQFASDLAAIEGLGRREAERVVAASIDRWVWYAGWSDKITQVAGNPNPVAGPYLNVSQPEPVGVVAVLAPPASSLLGLVSVLAPAIVTGNTTVVVASEPRPLPAITLAEVLATSDVPGGVVNIVTGRQAEIAGHLAGHEEVNGLDLTGAPPAPRVELQVAAAETLKRVWPGTPEGAADNWEPEPGIERMLAFLETKTVWHTKGV